MDKVKPESVTLEAGTYYWCNCGRDSSVALCPNPERDGCRVIEFSLSEPTWLRLCRCGRTANPPYCDDTHRQL